jgi:ABC-2 type transport system ATP-binding protein
MFLDEPTTGLDPQARLKVWSVIEEFKSFGGTVLLTTHYMDEASRLCDRVAVVDHGKIIALGTPAELVLSLGGDQIIQFAADKKIDESLLSSLPGVRTIRVQDEENFLTVFDAGAALHALLSEIERQEARIITLSTHQATLEDVFVHLTGRMLRDA